MSWTRPTYYTGRQMISGYQIKWQNSTFHQNHTAKVQSNPIQLNHNSWSKFIHKIDTETWKEWYRTYPRNKGHAKIRRFPVSCHRPHVCVCHVVEKFTIHVWHTTLIANLLKKIITLRTKPALGKNSITMNMCSNLVLLHDCNFSLSSRFLLCLSSHSELYNWESTGR